MPSNKYLNDLWILDYSQADIEENNNEINGCIWTEIETEGKVS